LGSKGDQGFGTRRVGGDNRGVCGKEGKTQITFCGSVQRIGGSLLCPTGFGKLEGKKRERKSSGATHENSWGKYRPFECVVAQAKTELHTHHDDGCGRENIGGDDTFL